MSSLSSEEKRDLWNKVGKLRNLHGYLSHLLNLVFGKTVHKVKKTILRRENEEYLFFQADLLYSYIVEKGKRTSVMSKFSAFFPKFDQVENDRTLNSQCALVIADELQTILDTEYIANFTVTAFWDHERDDVSLQLVVAKSEYNLRGINVQWLSNIQINRSAVILYCNRKIIPVIRKIFHHPSHYLRKNTIDPDKMIYPLLHTVPFRTETWRGELFHRADPTIIRHFFSDTAFLSDQYLKFDSLSHDHHQFYTDDEFQRFRKINESIAMIVGQYFGEYHPKSNYQVESWLKKDGLWIMLTIPRITLQLYGLKIPQNCPW
jgi:hypothetical protein